MSFPHSAGANLIENMTVQDAVFDDTTGLWTVIIEGSELKFKGRILLCADGSTSKLGTQLGIVQGPPTGTCSRAYIEGGTHRFKADGVMFFPPGLLPGFSPTTTLLLYCLINIISYVNTVGYFQSYSVAVCCVLDSSCITHAVMNIHPKVSVDCLHKSLL